MVEGLVVVVEIPSSFMCTRGFFIILFLKNIHPFKI